MTKQLLTLAMLATLITNCIAQPANIYQPNGSTTNFGKAAHDSLNYYVVNYPALTLMKIDGSNNATIVTTLTVDPFQTMIWNNGKGIYPVSNGSPFKLFDGTSAIDITGGQLPMAGYTGDKVIATDYFHKGNITYFRTNNKIYKTDFTSVASIQTLATVEYSVGTTEMQHTENSIIFSDVVSTSSAPPCLKRIDLATGNITKIDSSTIGAYDYGAVFNNEYYFCTPYGPGSQGISSVYKVSDNGTKTLLYTETASNKNFVRIVGVTPNGVIAIMATTSVGAEYVSISGGVATSLNLNTVSNSLPCGNVGVGTSRTAETRVYFETLDTLYTVNSTNKALWVTDGTLVGTVKVVGGPPTTFAIDNLSTQFTGSAEHCGDDLHFAGKNGSNATRLISVNGSNYTVQTNSFGLPSTQPSILKTASGIEMIGSPLPTSSAEKAIFKVSCSSITGILEIGNIDNEIMVYPNPTNDELFIETNFNYNLIEVYTAQGRLMQSNISSIKKIDVSDLNNGLYIIMLTDKNGNRQVQRFVKTN
jgi:hypothetical protein